MGDKAVEQLSALMDDELSVAELELLLRRMKGDAGYGSRWERFHLASEAMRNGLPERVDLGLAERIRAQVDDDPTMARMPPTAARSGWRRKPIVGLAVAASMAAAVAVGLRLTSESVPEMVGEPVELTLPRAAVDSPDVDEDGSVASLFLPANTDIESKMYPYLLNHNEQVSRSVAPKVLPLGRMVGYEINR